ncbi:MAG: DUF4340 domain-containing protein [Bacteroidetes bacterium]|nr:DUF4340 domain-containing protein [Bacteroidota bacterium]
MDRREIRLWTSLFLLTALSVAIGLFSSMDQKIAIDPFWRFGNDPVNRILISKGSEKADLTFQSGTWQVGDSLRANSDRISVFLAALARAQGRRYASPEQNDSLVRLVVKEGVRVEIFSGDKRLTEFLAFGNPEKQETWFMKAKGVPVQVAIPGYRTYLFSAFDVDPNRWRDLRVFDFNWRNFSGFKVEFPKDESSSFSIEPADGWFGIPGIAPVDTARINDYLDAVSLLKADEYRTSQGPLLDSLIRVDPTAILSARETSGAIHRLRVFDQGLAMLDDKQVLFFGRSKSGLLLTRKGAFRLKSN